MFVFLLLLLDFRNVFVSSGGLGLVIIFSVVRRSNFSSSTSLTVVYPVVWTSFDVSFLLESSDSLSGSSSPWYDLVCGLGGFLCFGLLEVAGAMLFRVGRSSDCRWAGGLAGLR